MSEEQNEIDIYESRRFEKAIKKPTESQLKLVEDEIEKIIENPEIGEQKKGDLTSLRVHKFQLDKQQALLGYSWFKDRLEIYLLQFCTHENFYKKMKGQHKVDRKFIRS